MTATHYDQGWIALQETLDAHGIELTADVLKEGSEAVAHELIRRGHLMSLEGAQRSAAAEVEAVRRAAS